MTNLVRRHSLLRVLFLSLMVSVVAAACGSGSESTTTAAGSDDGATTTSEAPDEATTSTTSQPSDSEGLGDGGTLEVTDWAATNEFYAEWVDEINAGFEAKYVGWTVNFTNIPAGEYATSMTPPMSTGQGPDVYPFLSEELDGTIANGWLLPLNDYLASSELGDRIPDWVTEVSSQDGNIYALARAATPQLLHTNLALLEEAGIEDVPETPEEFIEAAVAIQEATGNFGYMPFLDPAEAPFFYRTLAQWALGYGSDFAEPGQITIDVPEIRDAMTDLKRMLDEGVAPFGLAYTDARAVFQGGEAGFLIDGSWVAGEILGISPDDLYPNIWVSHVPFPTRNSLTGGGWVGINTSSGQPDAAWAWIEEYFSEEAVNAWVEGSLRPAGTNDPAPDSVYEVAPWYENVEDVAANHSTQLGYAPPGFQPNASEFQTEMVPFFVDILTGETSVEEGLAAAQAHMEEWADSLGLISN